MNPSQVYEVKSNSVTVEFSESYKTAKEAYDASQAKDKSIWLIPSASAGFKTRIL